MEQNLPLGEQGKSALEKAFNEARKRNQAHVSPEHLLLSLIGTNNNEAVRLLHAFDADPQFLYYRLDKELEQNLADMQDEPTTSPQLTRVLQRAIAESSRLQAKGINGQHLILGILSDGTSRASRLLQEKGVTLEAARAWLTLIGTPGRTAAPTRREVQEMTAQPAPVRSKGIPVSLSPIFILLMLIALGAGWMAYAGIVPGLTVPAFVIAGWVITLSLHEFGHALVAYIGGDHTVVDKGYLSLNPLKYTHVFLSIVLPVIFLLMGGIGLPGGAVYINHGLIRKPGMRSLMSAAGPIASALAAIVLLLPFSFGVHNTLDANGHHAFVTGLAVLAFLQVSAVLFNMIPLPGLDGFGIIAPFLPYNILQVVNRLRGFAFFLIIILFFNPTPVSRSFWMSIYRIVIAFGLKPELISEGLNIFTLLR